MNFVSNILKHKDIGGVTIGEKSVLVYSLKRALYLCGDFVTASKLKYALSSLDKKAEIIACGREVEDERDPNLFSFSSAVSKFLRGELDYLIFLPSSMTTKFDMAFLKESFSVKKGEEYSFDALSSSLVNYGYERTDYVNIEGQFALRGDILDIFLFGEDSPTRIEFFDEEVERIIHFEASSMKTIRELDSVKISPLILKFGKSVVTDIAENIIIDEPIKIENECSILKESRKNLSWANEELFAEFSTLLEKDHYTFSNFGEGGYNNKTIGQKSYLTDFNALKKDIELYRFDGNAILLYVGRYHELMEEFLQANKISYKKFDGEIEKGKLYVVDKYFPFSFSFLQEKIIAIGTDDLYKSKKVEFKKGKEKLSFLPKVGDYVVHSFYGIGICKDIVRLKLTNFEKDYFVLEYKNGALLYLPTEQANVLSAYIGGENPKLNALGSQEWAHLKNKVKENLKEVAIELAKIYKERATIKGFKFVRDEELEHEFDEFFPYELTPDQQEAIADVDKDMESDKIMDRLICGDVGFGKTEVAFRACFKAVYNSKQVAFLCPTTILSEQHFRSASARFKPFGVRVEVLNRFKSQKETNAILQKLKNGEIDILIGTHKILGKEVEFKDIGLLVLDEEQRFGVKDKEKIKKLKQNIDVLTLSATPIPRTLHMSLSSIRDISVIATPPKDRLPIQTYVTDYSDQLLVDTARRELSRGGKVLILFNRVLEIYNFASHVKHLLPEGKIGVAHGQMMEKELARVIDDLYDNKYNIFISTTLIENGVDLPSLNTLFVLDSDKLGLSQLYQIRGRIGRGDKLAYAYLTFDRGKILTEDAYKRLEAITEFRELGSGFKIAMRDLEIRGAGNILGKEQHGHMQKIGYDMYLKLLDEVTRSLKGGKEVEAKEIKIEMPIDAYINEDYIVSQEERIVFYDKISHISSEREKEEVLKELSLSNGDVPKETENLCEIALLKNLAQNFNVKLIRINQKECLVYFYKSKEIIDKRLSKMGEYYSFSLKFEELPILKLNSEESVENKMKLLIEMFFKALS
ncbi:MAG TPA: transcription-repair coupling factor [Candidatus Caccovivens faecavium]|nr:transcription-repair coupling factor [Candidatus Caccovivens faecavium]